MSTPNLSYVQSTDGKKLTFKDDTVYSDPISNYTRTVELYSNKDATVTLLATLTFLGQNLTVDHNITQDAYFSAKLVHVGSPSIATKIINFGTTMFEYIALDKRLLLNCGCSKNKGCDTTTLGALYLKRAEDQVLFGNSAKFNSYIQASLKVLNS